jgi:hypothetical protein
MKFTPVNSSNIKEIAYEEKKIFVKFKNDKVYSFVSNEEEFNDFLKSPSKGKFFHEKIKGRPTEIIDLEKLEESEPLQQVMT